MVQFRGMILCCEYNDGDYAQNLHVSEIQMGLPGGIGYE